MKKSFVFLSLVTFISLYAIRFDSPAWAQWDNSWQKQYPIGSNVTCSPVGDTTDWRHGVVVENFPNSGTIKVRVDEGNGRPGGVYIISNADTIRTQTAAPPAAPPGGAGNAAAANHAAGTMPGVTAEEAAAAAAFTVGETVLASPSYNSWDWRKGVVIDNRPDANFMRIKVEPGNGFPGGIQIVSRKAIKKVGAEIPQAVNQPPVAHNPAPVQAPPAAQANSPVNAIPPNTNNPAAPAHDAANQKSCCPPQASLAGNSLENILKRCIYDKFIQNGYSIETARYPATITFHSFTITGPRDYKMPEPFAYHTGSPDGPGGMPGTKVYDVRTKYTVCIDEQPNPEYGYKGYTLYDDYDMSYVALQHYQTHAWQVNQSARYSWDHRSVKK